MLLLIIDTLSGTRRRGRFARKRSCHCKLELSSVPRGKTLSLSFVFWRCWMLLSIKEYFSARWFYFLLFRSERFWKMQNSRRACSFKLGFSRKWAATHTRYSPLDQEALNLREREKLWSGYSSCCCYYAPPSLDALFSHQKKAGESLLWGARSSHRHPRVEIVFYHRLLSFSLLPLSFFSIKMPFKPF